MTEPKRATWSDFVEWLSAKEEHAKAHRSVMRLGADDVQTKREAMVVCICALGMGHYLAERAIEDWIAWLRLRAIMPPADLPSVAEALERLSYQFDACESDAASASSSLAWKTAAKMARAKAKEFT